jgi:Holliday junction resolvase RusA-like endonuclease
MKEVSFNVAGPMRGKQRPRATRMGRIYTPQETVNAEAYIKYLASQAMGSMEPFEGALKATFAIYVEIPKSFTKSRRQAALAGTDYPTTKPDLDNIVKLLADAMNGIVYKDDKQIVSICVSKKYAESASAHIYVGEM